MPVFIDSHFSLSIQQPDNIITDPLYSSPEMYRGFRFKPCTGFSEINVFWSVNYKEGRLVVNSGRVCLQLSYLNHKLGQNIHQLSS